MPAYPAPADGPAGPHWTAVIGAIQTLQAQVAALTAGATQGNLVDAYGNVVEVAGTNLAQTVTIGASHGVAGVQVGTNLTGAGRAFQQSLATGTITLTKGSATAYLAAAGSFANGMVIGAANVNDPGSGTPTPAIVPGTTILSGGGTTTLTLSAPAAESGTALYCAACYWRPLSGLNYP